MKVTKQEIYDTKNKCHNIVIGKKYKNAPASKSESRMEAVPEEAITVIHKGAELSKLKHVDVVNIIPHESQRDSISATETPILFSGDGILRQALLSFSYVGQDEKTLKDTITMSKKVCSVSKAQAIAASDIRLHCSSPSSLSGDSIQIPFSQKTLNHGMKSLPSGTILTGSLSLGNLPLVSLPPVTLSSGTFSQATLPLMSETTRRLPPVSEIPRPGNIPPLSSSSTVASSNAGTGIITAMPASFSEVPAYEVPQLGTSSLKVLVPLSSVPTSIHRATVSPIHVQTSASPSKENSVTLVCSSLPKMEPSILSTSQKVLPLPPMSEMKSRHLNHLHTLPHSEISVSSSSADSNDAIHEVIPVSTDILTVAGCTSRTSISVLTTPVSSDSTHGSSTNPIKLDENHDSAEDLSHGDSIPSIAVSHFQTSNGPSPDLNHIIIPVSSGINPGKLDDHQDIGQIITIPLTSSAIYGHPVGISIPLSGSAVPVQVSSGMLPMSCSLLPVSTTALQVSTSDHPTTTATVSPLLQTSDTVQSYPSVSPSTAGTTGQQQLPRISSDISSMVTVTSSMVVPISTTNTMTCVTSVSTAGNSVPGTMVPVTSSSQSMAVTSVPSSSVTTTTATMVFATQTTSVEPVATYTMQSPAEILSQLSKARVFPTMSSSQVSSVLSALASDGCHLDLEADSSHHVELLTQQQVMQLPDKVSTLTQTEDHTIELGCSINKVVNVAGEVHLTGNSLHLLNHAQAPSLPLQDKQHTVVEMNGPVDMGTDTLKQLPPIYPRITSKINDFITTAGPPKSSNARKRGSDSVTRLHSETMFIKQEELEGHKLNNKVGNEGTSKKQQGIRDAEVYSFAEQVACYKCKLCPFLTLESKNVALHVQLVHGNQPPEPRHEIKCPGCKNVFFTSKSLRVHLSQDHQVSDEELRTLVEVVIKTSFKDAKAKNKLYKKRRKSIAKSQSPAVNLESDGKDLASVVEVSEHMAPEILVDECSKIRVRDLNQELPGMEETPSDAGIATVHVRNEDNHNSNVVADADVREGPLVIDDDPLIQQKRTKMAVEEGCEFKMIKTDAEPVVGPAPGSDMVVCNAGEPTVTNKDHSPEVRSTEPTAKKRRGRPKGSKNVTDTGYRKLTPAQKVLEKELGYRCDIDGCAVRLRSHDNIEYHRRCHHGEKFLCPECSEETIHWNTLSTHLWRYHVIDMELFSCDQCSYKTNSYSKLMNVHRRIHGDERPFLCDTCGKGFKNPKQMRNHKAIHVSKQKKKNGPSGECDVCGRSFSNSRMLRIHKDNVHGKLRPHLCNYCGYSASSRSTLKMHMRLHTGEKPFHCDECEYMTADHNSLRRHKMRHSGDKPYKCPHCSYACIQSSTYKAHLNTKHPGLETGLMFSCHMCSFRSVRKDNYLAHVAEHESGANPSNRHRKHSSPKPQDDSNKTTKQQEMEKSRLPVIINISNIITPVEPEGTTLAEDNVEPSDNVHLIYNSSSVEGLLRQSAETVEEGRFGVEMSTDSVIHLVEDLDANSNNNGGQTVVQNVQTLCVANIETVTEMPLTPEFEAEQITGDIQDIKEPQELKFKVAEDLAS
ncbi:uncharacterized protein [Periplaneta americana]|uniref:uncharacterized protein n=1 Tax=Periplaneta americana TaxID=6978 RepID=UPI0037E73C62